MNIFDYAMQKEKHAEQMYRDLAAKAPDPGFASILTLLADHESKHFAALKRMQEKSPELAPIETDILPQARSIFEKMKSGLKKFDFTHPQIELYRKAQQIEAESRNFYLEKSNEVKGEAQKGLFLQLAEEEKKHYVLLDNIIEFVSRPEIWLENAEWHHLDQY
jgi:rubrerythrin